MKLKDRSLKSREKFADSLMSLANVIHGAVLISVFAFPLTAFISAVFTGVEPYSFLVIFDRMSGSNFLVFLFVYSLPIIVGAYGKHKAMDLYDEIAKANSQP